MTYKDLIELVSYRHAVTKKAAREILEDTFGAIREEAICRRRTVIPRFGTFTSKKMRTSGKFGAKTWSKPAAIKVKFTPSIHAQEEI